MMLCRDALSLDFSLMGPPDCVDTLLEVQRILSLASHEYGRSKGVIRFVKSR